MRIRRKDIPTYITEELKSYIAMWQRIKKYGWPQNKGYLAEPETVRILVELFDGEKETYLAWENQHGRTD